MIERGCIVVNSFEAGFAVLPSARFEAREKAVVRKMGNVFGKEKPLKEQLRENKRMITRAIRELDREKRSLEKEEQRLSKRL